MRPVAEAVHDPRLDGLETAAVLAGADTTEDLLQALCTHGGRVLGAEWVAVIDLAAGAIRAGDGPVPSDAWLAAFVSGSQAAANETEPTGSDDPISSSDTAWAPLPAAGLAVVVGRSGTPFRARERRQVSAMARIVDTRFRELARLRSRLIHPSASAGPGEIWPGESLAALDLDAVGGPGRAQVEVLAPRQDVAVADVEHPHDREADRLAVEEDVVGPLVHHDRGRRDLAVDLDPPGGLSAKPATKARMASRPTIGVSGVLW